MPRSACRLGFSGTESCQRKERTVVRTLLQRAGADGCGFTAKAATESELRAKLETHVKAKHKVDGMTDTIDSYLRATAAR